MLPVSPAAAAPWWWAQFPKGDDVFDGTQPSYERWLAFAINDAATSDTVYIASFTWGTGNNDPISGLGGSNNIGLNAIATAKSGIPNNYVITEGAAGPPQLSADAQNVLVPENPSTASLQHNKLIVIPGRRVVTGSANLTAGAYSSQPNNMLVLLAPCTGVIARYTSQMEEFRAGTYHDNTASGANYVFYSPNGDTIEIYFSPDDHGNIPTGSGPGKALTGSGGDVEGVVTRVISEATESVFYLTNQTNMDRSNFQPNPVQYLYNSSRFVEGCLDHDYSTGTVTKNDLQADHTCRDADSFYSDEMHHKFFVVDQDIVITGSANLTSTALSSTTGNDENVIVVHDFRLARRFLQEYRRVMGRLSSDTVGAADSFETTDPGAPGSLTVTPAAASFDLSWTASAATDVSRYFIWVDTQALTAARVGDDIDDDGDGLVDEDPVGDADGFPSGTAGPGAAADDDADGSSDEDQWMFPELQVKGKASTAATVRTIGLGSPLQAGTNYYFAVCAVDTHGNESILATAGPYQLAANVIVYNQGTLTDTTAAAGDTHILAQYVRVSGAAAGDTVTRFSVDYTGTLDSSSVTRVQLWADDGDSAWDSGDTYVGQLYWNSTSGWWDTTTIAYQMGVSSATFLVTIDIAGSATPGSTFQAFIPVNGVKTSGRDTGPIASVTSGRTVTIASSYTVVINEILADVPTGWDVNGDGVSHANGDEFVELYNYGGSSVDISGWSLRDGGGAMCTFPANTVLRPGGWAVMFPYATDTAGFLVPYPVFAGNNGSFTLNNTNDSLTLYTTALDTVDFKQWGAEGGVNQSLTRVPESSGAGIWTQHETADTRDASSYSPGTGIFWADVRVTGAIPAAQLSQGDTDKVLLIVRFTPYPSGDTLLAFTAQNLGSASDTDLFNVRFVRDANSDSVYTLGTDTIIAAMSWSAAHNMWQAAGMTSWVPDNSAQYLVVSSIDSSATVGDTIQLRPFPYGTAFARTDTGPCTPADSNPYVQAVKSPSTVLDAVVNTPCYYGAFYGSDTLPLLSFNVTNSAGVADTLTSVIVQTAAPYSIDTRSLATLRLWADADTVGELGSGDTFIATLTPAAIGIWSAAISWPMSASGATLLVTACATASPVIGDSVMLQVPLLGLQSSGADSGPALSAATNSMYQFTTLHAVLISEIEGNPAGTDAGAEYVELYNPTGSPVSLTGWKLQYHSSANNPYTNNPSTTLATFGTHDSVPARGFFLIGGDTTLINFGVVPNYYNNSIAMDDAKLHVTLRNSSNVIIDLVGGGTAGWGEGNTRAPAAASTNEVMERKAADTSTAATMSGSDSRAGNAHDSDRNVYDWVLTTANPQNSFSDTEPLLIGPTVYTVQVDTLVTVAAAGVAPGATDARALAVTITGHAQGDTLTHFALTNLSDAGSDTACTAVRLWRDENASGSHDALDTFVAALQRSGSTWSAFIPAADSAALAGAGTAFLVTVDVDSSAVLGETFQVRVTAVTIGAVRAETGPLAALTGNILTVSLAAYSITGTAPLQAAPLDSGTRLYLYDLGGALVDSYTVTSDTGFFSLTASDGTYYLYIVGPHHLATRVNGVVVSGSGTDLGTLPEQPAGDVNRDNRIDILDASYIRGALGSSNSVADLDSSSTVTSSDLSYIYSNYGQIGASSVP